MVWRLAQVNIARFRKPADDPANADFVGNLERINALAESAPGFIWRLKGEGAGAVDIHAFDDPLVAINLSVWTDVDALAAFAYRNPEHRAFLRRREEWFEAVDPYLALWWIIDGHTPAPAEARARLEHLAAHGPTPHAFTFKSLFPTPDEA